MNILRIPSRPPAPDPTAEDQTQAVAVGTRSATGEAHEVRARIANIEWVKVGLAVASLMLPLVGAVVAGWSAHREAMRAMQVAQALQARAIETLDRRASTIEAALTEVLRSVSRIEGQLDRDSASPTR